MSSTASPDLAAWLTAPLLPVVALGTAVHARWRADWRQRWGLEVPGAQPGATWIAASSVGEVRAGLGLAGAMDGPILLTADTDTGAAVARQWLGGRAGRKPVDHPWTLAPLWAEARPGRLVWVEGCWWPALDALARRDGVPTVRVNARRGRSSSFRLAAGFEADQVFTCEVEDVHWFRERGVRAEVGGDLKWAAPSGPNPLSWGRSFGVACSTRPGDEAALLADRAELPWLIAPRHASRLPEVETALAGTRWIRRSRLANNVVPDDVDIVLLDTMGELASCLTGASVAFVGGTFDPGIGGHSPVEAALAGVPVVAGPHVGSQGRAFAEVGATIVARPDELGVGLRAARGQVHTVAGGVDVGAVVRALDPAGTAPERSPRPWAAGLASAHRRARTGWHRSWESRETIRLGVPVVSIGSANARSPGRTPTVRWMLEQLSERGYRPGVATRGYRRAGGGLGCSWVTRSIEMLGDEAALLARAGWPVAVCADRVEAGRALVEHGVDVVVLDDGLQHRRLHRDLDLVVVDGRYPTARGEFPMGEAREAPIPARAHGVVWHHGTPPPLGLPVATARRVAGTWHRGTERLPRGPEGPVAAFAGIGRPADFRSSLELEVGRFRALADHQLMTPSLARDLVDWADGLPLVCTDKDHVRLPAALAASTWWRTVRLTVSGAPESWFDPGSWA